RSEGRGAAPADGGPRYRRGHQGTTESRPLLGCRFAGRSQRRPDEVSRPALPPAPAGALLSGGLVSKSKPRENEGALWRAAMKGVRPLNKPPPGVGPAPAPRSE